MLLRSKKACLKLEERHAHHEAPPVAFGVAELVDMVVYCLVALRELRRKMFQGCAAVD